MADSGHEPLAFPDCGFEQSIVLSTCNRVEVYAYAADELGAVQKLRDALLARWGGVAGDFESLINVYVGDAVPAHLFRVAAGLDSAVIGESEVLGQVGTALRHATQAGLLGQRLARLFQHAVRTGRRVRTETAIGREPHSIATAAVKAARIAFGKLERRNALIIGAGETGALMARALRSSGLTQILITNRTPDRAKTLADEIEGRCVPWHQLRVGLAAADLVVVATAAPMSVINAADIGDAMRSRPDRPLLLFDVAVPRNVDPSVAFLPGVALQNIDDLNAALGAGMERQREQIALAEAIVADEVEKFCHWWHTLDAVPDIALLHRYSEELRQRELAKALRHMPNLSIDERAMVDGLTRGLVHKLIHHQIMSLKGWSRDKISTGMGTLPSQQ